MRSWEIEKIDEVKLVVKCVVIESVIDKEINKERMSMSSLDLKSPSLEVSKFVRKLVSK